MSQKLDVSFESPQSGWMSMRLQARGQSFVAVMSCRPYDSLRDLLNGLTTLTERGHNFTVKWNAEPDEYEFRFLSSNLDVELQVVHFTDHRREIKSLNVAFSFHGPRQDVCRAFWRELKHLRDRSETDVFEQNWRRSFPVHELQEFTQALKSHRR